MIAQTQRQPNAPTEPSARRRWRRPRGTILVLVLGTILVLSALITAFLEIERKEIILRGMYFGREPMRIAAYSALESTLSVLNAYLQIDGGLYGPVQGWGDPLHQKAWSNDTENTEGATMSIFEPPDGMTVNITITDLTGCMPLDRMSSTEFLAMFDTMNVDPTQAQVLVDTYLDWTSPYTGTFTSDGAGSDYYEGLDPAYDPTYTNITDFNEFHYLKNWQDLFWDKDGHETPIFEQFKKIVTLHDWGTGGTNINTAPTEVLDVLSDQDLLEIDETVTEPYLWGQDGIPNTADDMLARNSDELTLAGYLGTTSGSAATGNTSGNGTSGNGTNGTPNNNNTNRGNTNNNNPGSTPPANNGQRGAPPNSASNSNPNSLTFAAMAATPPATSSTPATSGTPAAGGTPAASTASTTTIGVSFLCRLMKINVMVSLGDSHFLLSTIVKPNNVGTGVPTATSSSGSTGTSGSTSGGSTYTPTVTNTSGAYPFTIVQSAENYDIP